MLEDVLERIEKAKKMAEMDLSKVDSNILVNMKGRKQRAAESLGNLYYEYKSALSPNILFILASGSGCKKLADVAEEDYAAMSYPAEIMFEEIVSRIDTSNYVNKSMSSSVVDILSSCLEDRMIEIGVKAYPAIVYTDKYAKLLKSKDDLVTVSARMITDMVGSEIVGVDILDRVAMRAVKKSFKGKVLPVVLYSKDTALINKLAHAFEDTLTDKVFTVYSGVPSVKGGSKPTATVSGKVSKESVGKAMKKIKDLLN
jgi:hypothetical protein